MEMKYTQSVEAITKKFGTSYYFATRFLPSELREATYALYSFFRIPDEIVDNASKTDSIEKIRQDLDDWQTAWEQAYATQNSIYPILNLTAQAFYTYNIPYQYSLDFLEAMKQDVWVSQYETYRDLQKYMYGSAEVVGLIMTYLIGYNNPKALEHAKLLGQAMQLTNFIRDIGEDYDLRQRIYLPLEDRQAFQVTESMLKAHKLNSNLKELIKFEIQRNRALYRQANAGIVYLHKNGRFAVRLASRMYEAILDKIEQQNYDVFTKRARTSTREKIYILGKVTLDYGLQK